MQSNCVVSSVRRMAVTVLIAACGVAMAEAQEAGGGDDDTIRRRRGVAIA